MSRDDVDVFDANSSNEKETYVCSDQQTILRQVKYQTREENLTNARRHETNFKNYVTELSSFLTRPMDSFSKVGSHKLFVAKVKTFNFQTTLFRRLITMKILR